MAIGRCRSQVKGAHLPGAYLRPIMNPMNDATAITEADVTKRLFHGTRLLRREDYRALEAVGKPLHTYRQITPLSDGIAISPLAHLALQNLNQPTVNRFMALRTGMRELASPGLIGAPGPMNEMGLVSLSVHASLTDTQLTHAISARKNWGEALERHAMDGNLLWTNIFFTLDHLRELKPRWKSLHGGTHLKMVDKWNEWGKRGQGQYHPTEVWTWPEPNVETQIRLIEARLLSGRLDPDSVRAHGWHKMTWLALHCQQPQAVAEHLNLSLLAGLEHYQNHRTYRRGRDVHFSDRLDDDDLCDTYAVLTQRLGQWQDPNWDVPGLAEALPKLFARHREHDLNAVALAKPVSLAKSTRRRLRA